MISSFGVWAVITGIAFVVGFGYMTYCGLLEKDFPKNDYPTKED
jgi:hypothetical protein